MENFFLPSFIECLGRGTCAYYINNLDYWLAQNTDLTQPGMWGMGNVYSGIEDILDHGVSRCVVCARMSTQASDDESLPTLVSRDIYQLDQK